MSFEAVWGFDPDEVLKHRFLSHVSRMCSNPPMKPTRNVPHASRRISRGAVDHDSECSRRLHDSGPNQHRVD